MMIKIGFCTLVNNTLNNHLHHNSRMPTAHSIRVTYRCVALLNITLVDNTYAKPIVRSCCNRATPSLWMPLQWVPFNWREHGGAPASTTADGHGCVNAHWLCHTVVLYNAINIHTKSHHHSTRHTYGLLNGWTHTKPSKIWAEEIHKHILHTTTPSCMLLHTLWKPVLKNKITTKHMRHGDGEAHYRVSRTRNA